MQIHLVCQNSMSGIVLPLKASGQFWLSYERENHEFQKILNIEGIQGEWVAKSGTKAVILQEENKKTKSIILEPNSIYNIYLKDYEEKAILFTEELNEEAQTFHKYLLQDGVKLSIGRGNDNDIIFTNKFVSLNHAELLWKEEVWYIRDEKSTNGTFVNGVRVQSGALNYGDCVYVMGLKIIVGRAFIAVNNPNGQLSIKTNVLRECPVQQTDDSENEINSESEKSYFYRPPRFMRDLEPVQISVDLPPNELKTDDVPMALMLGPAITMGIASALTAAFSVINVIESKGKLLTAMPAVIMSVSMMIGTILWPILTKKNSGKKEKKEKVLRRDKYLKYLDKVRVKIAKECDNQRDVLIENRIDIKECKRRIYENSSKLWERTPEHKDFLELRTGIGDMPMMGEIKFQEKRFTIDDDELVDELYKLMSEPTVLKQVPVTHSLLTNFISGIVGDRSGTLDFMRGFILQMASLHSYDEVKMVFLYDEKEESEFEFAKWLPHSWDNKKSIRYIATDIEQVNNLSIQLEKELGERKEAKYEYQHQDEYFVIFAMSHYLFGKSDFIQSLLDIGRNIGISVLAFFTELNELPKECSYVIELEKGKGQIYNRSDISGKRTDFISDIEINRNESILLGKKLANVKLDLSSQRYSLPKMLTFLEMFRVGKVEHLNSLIRWKENNPTNTLQTPVGVDTTGEIFQLDLHEQYHGPHGLVAGMTGSGKSEFIITYILSLAVNYHPNEVAFILIDYKGGGLTGAFENEKVRLPHLAGTITNLDGASIKRSLISIQSELRRRQAVFNEARKAANEGTMDIYKYQALYRNGIVREPVPHLFIISDEFAELKTQQPEFMEQLISAARIGRSLGVHLILATQKPAGVVDDQIWSNSKFRICLKVQEKADSMDMIKRPDAAELVETGRFYLQVGFNELFKMGQSAWCGAPYIPSDVVEKQEKETIEVIDGLGHVVLEGKIAGKKKSEGKTKQIVEITEYLTKLSKEENIQVRQLWLEAIPEFIYVDQLKKKYETVIGNPYMLNPVIGEFDDPFNQRQEILTLPLSQDGNAILYGMSGSGKTTLLTALVYSLLQNHNSRQLNLYIMDFGSETLKVFGKAPQVGEVLLAGDEEKCINLFKQLKREILTRKKAFADYGGEFQAYCKKAEHPVPNILVIIHNFATFIEIYEELENEFAYVSREGAKYGIHFLVTASATNAVRYRLLQNFNQMLSLQLNDTTEYSIVLGNTEGVYPSKIKGRGLVKLDRIYEFQTAHAIDSDNEFDYFVEFCKKLDRTVPEKEKAPEVAVLPEKVSWEFIKKHLSSLKRFPIGVHKQSLDLVTWDFETPFVARVLGNDREQTSLFVQGLAECLGKSGLAEITVFDAKEDFIGISEETESFKYIKNDLEANIVKVFENMVERNNYYKNNDNFLPEEERFNRRIYIIHSMSELCDMLSEDGKDKLLTLLDKCKAAYRVNFIVAEVGTGIRALAIQPWYKQHITDNDGIWAGDGIAEQIQLKLKKVTNDLYKPVEDYFGYSVKKGKCQKIKLLSTEKQLEDE